MAGWNGLSGDGRTRCLRESYGVCERRVDLLKSPGKLSIHLLFGLLNYMKTVKSIKGILYSFLPVIKANIYIYM
ncbi:hypothetical protein CANARDRAFT_96004 [[Candida] arabinofermentans NRRL YB-2248]|uniref:Uncharacterized protein n=1 Tax=[Candida] arabinofermentans NRRL YB-2248 TaxID=983967 RepID=A0A1E4T6P0_9ASCO|nr:hypothetical protein CANARDRAFT_96004 [[Candida] arabinofermentans NRRL YB-2248]